MEDFSNIYMPCWNCPFGHSCRFYQDALWDQWILNYKSCPVTYNLPFSHAYNKAKEKKRDINSLAEKTRTW